MLSPGCGRVASFPASAPITSVRPHTSSGDLLYVSDSGNKAVYIYSYPGDAKVGQLTGLGNPDALCVDRTGDVFVVNHPASGGANILEFAHGKTTPIQTLDDSHQAPGGCAVSPVTGDLAVANICPVKNDECKTYRRSRADILIYPRAKGTPRAYRLKNVQSFYFCGYDATGDLFADARTRKSFELVELPKGSSSLKPIFVSFTNSTGIDDPGGVQWDGEYLAVGNAAVEELRPLVYRIDTSNWKVISTLKLRHAYDVPQFFIYGHALIAPNSGQRGGQILFYSYPKGLKSRTKAIDGFRFPISVVVSPGTRG
jgi:hypothetical protein